MTLRCKGSRASGIELDPTPDVSRERGNLTEEHRQHTAVTHWANEHALGTGALPVAEELGYAAADRRECFRLGLAQEPDDPLSGDGADGL